MLTNAEIPIGTEKILFAEGTKIRFYSDGKVAAGFPVSSVGVSVSVWPGRPVSCAALRELAWDSAGRLIYANVNESRVYQTPEKESFTIEPGEWVYLDYPKGGPPQAYPINLQGRLKRDTPLTVAGTRLTLPRGSLVAFKGDDTIMTLLSPAAPLVYRGEVLVPARAEVVFSDLEAKLTEMGGK
ncbi:MAG: hypothetical protein IPN19_15235 [Elusimicrobia bacterium]|nr:hypothetical protein [Elusimicrobiota bacterium]